MQKKIEQQVLKSCRKGQTSIFKQMMVFTFLRASEFLQFFKKNSIFVSSLATLPYQVIFEKNEPTTVKAEASRFKMRSSGSLCDFFLKKTHRFKLSTTFRYRWYSYLQLCLLRNNVKYWQLVCICARGDIKRKLRY